MENFAAHTRTNLEDLFIYSHAAVPPPIPIQIRHNVTYSNKRSMCHDNLNCGHIHKLQDKAATTGTAPSRKNNNLYVIGEGVGYLSANSPKKIESSFSESSHFPRDSSLSKKALVLSPCFEI